jgi:hypothetical protein
MRTRLTAALLLGGHLLLASLTPVAAMAAPVPPAGPPATGSYRALDSGCYGCGGPDHRRDDHYRCMYHCDERYGYGRRDGYDRSRYDYRYRQDRYRRDRVYHNGECWYNDARGWHRCGYDYRYGYDSSGGGGSDSSDYRGYENDSAHAGGGYDSHRHHPR